MPARFGLMLITKVVGSPFFNIDRLMGDGMAVAATTEPFRLAGLARVPLASSGRMRHRPQPHGHFAIFLILSHYGGG